MGNLVVIGLGELRPHFVAYEQFMIIYMERVLLTLMIVDLYGTAPWSPQFRGPLWGVPDVACQF